MNMKQRKRLQLLCERYNVEFREPDYIQYPATDSMMAGWVEGWLGGSECAGSTLYVGVSPAGESHS